MAGMLPGVECARRRRFHQGGCLEYSQNLGAVDHRRRRRTSFCLYQESLQQTQNHHQTNKTEQKLQRGLGGLHGVAREAKERLDEKLRASACSISRRRGIGAGFWTRGSSESVSPSKTCPPTPTATPQVSRSCSPADCCEGLSKAAIDQLERRIYGERNGSSTSRWKSKNKWKLLLWTRNGRVQEECAVCLEAFKAAQVLIHLPCNHRFHSGCLLPWLIRHSHCPYCRNQIPNMA